MLTKKYSACTSILVGKKASLDGSIMIGRNEDAKAAWPKHFVIHQHGELTNKFVSKDNGFTLQLPKNSAKYSATPEWTDKFGLFEEDGINEFNVAMSATESAYTNNNVLAADPLVKDGINEEAMITVILPFIRTAREGIIRLGSIIAQYGTNETNGILFADNDEAWYMETAGGHYWVARRIPDNSYAVVSNQLSIQEIDFTDKNNFMYHAGIQTFVSENKLNPSPNTFNFRQIFGTHDRSDAVYNTPRVWFGQQKFSPRTALDEPESMDLPFIMQPDQLISIEAVQSYLSSHFEGTPFDPIGTGASATKHKYRPISLAKTQESHILQMNRPTIDIHWLAMGVSAQSIYVPFFANITTTPKPYQRGKATYSPQSAYWTFKLVGVLVDSHLREFMPLLDEIQNKLKLGFGQTVNQIDQDLLTSTAEQQTNLTTKKSIEMANLALTEYRNLSTKLITLSTDLSLLNFKTDDNL